MSEHTQGPWHTGGDGTIIYDKDGWGIASATVFHGRQEPGTAAANARRIVACVNACEGASTEVLERGAVHDWGLLMTEMEKQRDALLAALEQCAASMQGDKLYVNTLAYAQRAIAAVKGGA